MRIAFLCKRRYMGKDVILDRYARLYEIPHQLARLGHDVRGYCLDYHQRNDGEWEHDGTPGRLRWESRSLDALKLMALSGYPRRVLQRLREFDPDLLIGASDIPQVALTGWIARRMGLPYVVDLYDNFEGFGQARIPGFKSLLRQATRHAPLVTTTSEPLRQLVLDEWGARGCVIAMPSSIDTSLFHPMNRSDTRKALGLPIDAMLIGTAGGLHRDKGIAPLYAAWDKLSVARSDVHLVLAGLVDAGLPPPTGDRVHYLGQRPHSDIAQLFNALDVGVITIPDTVFGRFSFPQKAYEMLACGLPVVAADVGAMNDLFADTPQVMFRHDDAQALATAILCQLENPSLPSVPIKDWAQLIAEVERQLPRH